MPLCQWVPFHQDYWWHLVNLQKNIHITTQGFLSAKILLGKLKGLRNYLRGRNVS